MKLPNTAHTSQPWRIHELAEDFVIEDVWALPTPGGPEEFGRLVSTFVSDESGSFPEGAPLLVQFLWRVRMRLGARLGWDDEDDGVGSRVPSLRDRLPPDLRDGPTGPAFADVPFTPVYLLEREWVAELANRTVHALLHLSWVPDGATGYRGQMAVLVRPKGWLGKGYLAAIKPLRLFIVYPALLQSIGRDWRAGAGRPASGLPAGSDG